MGYELRIALTYLWPRRGSLSRSFLSILSVFLISLVVWLVLVFLSVTGGIEQRWIGKLTSLHAPIRLSPTDAYYHSYYYQVDSLAAASHFALKSIHEKAVSEVSDPYSPLTDREIPRAWPAKEPVDLVKGTLACLNELHLTYDDYEIGGALLRLQLHPNGGPTQWLSQMSYLLSISEENPHLSRLILTPELVSGDRLYLPSLGSDTPVLLPKIYRESGAAVGDRGTLSFQGLSAASTQEQRISVQVAGFYDPGFLPGANRCLLVPPEITHLVQASTQTFSPDGTPTNGLFVWTDDLSQVPAVAQAITQKLSEKGLLPYWKVATYHQFEFARDLLNQFQSDRTLLVLVALLLLTVACSNIITLLVLLVHEKRREIAILRSLGARTSSIAAIFGAAGALTGLLAGAIGSLAALYTLEHIDTVAAFLTQVQGHTAFNPAYFGEHLPQTLSSGALLFVLIATPLLSLLAGLVPALRACRIAPSPTLRSS